MKERREEISISVFKATCLERLAAVKRTRVPIVVTKRGEPVAIVMPPPEPATWIGALQGSARIAGDVVEPVVAESEYEILGE